MVATNVLCYTLSASIYNKYSKQDFEQRRLQLKTVVSDFTTNQHHTLYFKKKHSSQNI